MHDDSADRTIEAAGSPFAAVNAVARRARQLVAGFPPLVADPNVNKPAMTAMREIAAGRVTLRAKKFHVEP